MSNILIIKHGSLGDIAQASGAIQDISDNHQNDNQTDAIAYFTQGTWQINDEFALTLGARYAEDEKEALELTGGYAELYASVLGGFLPVINLLGGNPYIPIGADSTIEAQTNVAMGNATWNYNPTTLAQMQG